MWLAFAWAFLVMTSVLFLHQYWEWYRWVEQLQDNSDELNDFFDEVRRDMSMRLAELRHDTSARMAELEESFDEMSYRVHRLNGDLRDRQRRFPAPSPVEASASTNLFSEEDMMDWPASLGTETSDFDGPHGEALHVRTDHMPICTCRCVADRTSAGGGDDVVSDSGRDQISGQDGAQTSDADLGVDEGHAQRRDDYVFEDVEDRPRRRTKVENLFFRTSTT